MLERLEDRLAPASLSGTVFEDVNYGGGPGRSLAASAGAGRPNATVELYDAAGNFLTATTTNASGVYTFSGLADGTSYSVRVVDSTVTSSRPGSSAGLLPVETFQTDASSGTVVAVTTDVGGAVPSAQDSGAKAAGGNLNDDAVEESVTRVQVGAGVASVTGLDFGFNFDTIVNTNATGQGSLAQFITNSNTLGNTGLAQVGQSAGAEASIFMIPSTADPLGRPADPNFSGGVAVIQPFPDLPTISDAFTHIDGTTQTANIGDTNPGVAGTGGTVGVDNLTLDTVNRPEVEIVGLGDLKQGFGLTVAANDDAILGIAIRGFSFNIFIKTDSQRTTVERNLVGLTPTGTRPTDQTDGGGENVFSDGGIDGVVRNNILAFGGSHGVILNTGSTGWVVEDNEIRSNSQRVLTLDGAEFNNGSTGNTLEGNLLIDNQANGVDLLTASGANTITENTITHNGFGGVEDAGILTRDSGTTITFNIISDNYGAGVAVTAQASDVLISRNSIFANGTEAAPGVGPATGEIGIDLLTPTDPVTGTPPFVTPNHPGGGAPGGNGLVNFPVLTTATITGGDLELGGFARPGSIIELFIAAPDASGFGEGKTYLATLTEGSAQDLDTGTGSYGAGPVNGLDQGSDTTNRFLFLVPLASLPAAVGNGTVLTATATLADPSTSEFSGDVTVVGSPQPALVVAPPNVSATAFTVIVAPSPVLEDVALVFRDTMVTQHFALVNWGDGHFNVYDLGISGGGVFSFQHRYSRHTKIRKVVVHVYLFDAQLFLGALLGGESATFL
jgi:parallel beta-helix repeat protein